jgi:hypothetical protein
VRAPEIIGANLGVNAADTSMTDVPHVGDPGNTFSSTFTELTASSDYDACGALLYVRADPGNAGNSVNQLKLYAGASGSETEFLHVIGPANLFETGLQLHVPIPIPAGTRITAKSASFGGFRSTECSLKLIRGSVGDGMHVSRGTIVGLNAGAMIDVDAGATANTKGAWTLIETSTPRDAKGFTLLVTQDLSDGSGCRYLVDLAVGPAFSEVIIFPDAFLLGVGSLPRSSSHGPVWTPIPAGSRLSARAACSVTTATSRVPLVAAILWE